MTTTAFTGSTSVDSLGSYHPPCPEVSAGDFL